MVSLALVTLRWSLFVGRGGPANQCDQPGLFSRRWRVLWSSVVLGQMINILVPLRFGEGARVAVTTRGLDVPVGRVMVGAALERAFDVAAFGTFAALLIVSGWMPAGFRGVVPASATVAVGTFLAGLLFVRLLPTTLAWLRTRLGVLAPAAAWIEKQESAMRDGWTDIMRRHQIAAIALLTAIIPISAAATNLLVFQSFNLQVPAFIAFVLLVVIQIGTAVVSVPGNVGVFHYITVATLTAWDVPQATALAVAIVLHLVSIAPKVFLGAMSAKKYL